MNTRDLRLKKMILIKKKKLRIIIPVDFCRNKRKVVFHNLVVDVTENTGLLVLSAHSQYNDMLLLILSYPFGIKYVYNTNE